MWVGYLYHECQRAEKPAGWLGGLLPVEYENYRSLLSASDRVENTVDLPPPEKDGSNPAEGTGPTSVAADPRHVVVAADKVAALLEGAPRVALLDAVVSGPEGETGPEAKAMEAIMKELAGHRCFGPSSRRRRRKLSERQYAPYELENYP